MIINDTAISPILTGDLVDAVIASAPHDELQGMISALNIALSAEHDDYGAHSLATSGNDGLMTSEDKIKLDAEHKDDGTHNYFAKNAIINGNFGINQRVVSGTVVLASDEYGHDRFKGGASGCTYTFETSDNATTISISAGSLIQVIEGLNLQNDSYTLSWEGTAQGKIGDGSYSDSGLTATVSGGVDLNIEFDTGTLSKVQFELGSNATDFEMRSIGEEIALCQRYFEKSHDIDVDPTTTDANGHIQESSTRNRAEQTPGVRFAIEKRTVPVVTIYALGTGNSGKVTNSGDKTAVVSSVGTKGFAIVTITSGTVVTACQWHYTADAEL